MKLKLVTNLFYGFYNTIFDETEYIYEAEKEDLTELENKLGQKLTNYEIIYEHENESLQRYKTEVCQSFINEYIEKLEELIPNNIQEKDNYLFNIEFLAILSPKYYNYSTDTIMYELETNKETLQNLKEYTLQLPNAEEYIHKKYTSRDGYTSFLENDIQYWKRNEIESQENYLGALLDMLIQLLTDDAIFKLNIKAYEETDPEYSYMTRYLENKSTHNRIKYTTQLDNIKRFIKEKNIVSWFPSPKTKSII